MTGTASAPDATAAYSLGSREAQLERLRHGAFDLLVVGGGITGAGVAWDAATRGMRVGLIEQGDFAGGTSSRSSKLIHGGLRYLAQGHLGLTREAVAERGKLQRLVPHLVQLLPFAFPIYRGVKERAKLTAGLWLYDAFAAGSGAPRHSWIDKTQLRALAPGIEEDDLAGAFVYRDARTDDARMVVEVLRGAAAHGAAVANYVAMQGQLTAKGQAIGVAALDRLSGEPLEIRARRVVLATGVWMNQLVPPTNGKGQRVRPAKGVHLVLPQAKFPQEAALYLSTTSDDRLIFVIPWLGHTLVGTTDTDYHGDLAAPRASAEDVRYLLEAVNRAFPGALLSEEDVLSSQAGLRPLISDGDRSTDSASREDRVWETETGAIAIAGGKLTTFRKMAEKVVDLAAKRLEFSGGNGSVTEHTPLGGFAEPLPPETFLAWQNGVLAEADEAALARRSHLIGRYGANYVALERLWTEDPALAEPLVPTLPYLRAEVVFAVRHEQAESVGDVLARRLRLTLLTADQGRSAAPYVADVLAHERGWDAARREAALREFEQEIAQYAVPV